MNLPLPVFILSAAVVCMQHEFEVVVAEEVVEKGNDANSPLSNIVGLINEVVNLMTQFSLLVLLVKNMYDLPAAE